MARLIDADAVRKQMDEKRPGRAYEDAWALTVLDNAPTVVAVPVARCRDFKHLDSYRRAETDGRLIVLPCNVGARVWFIAPKSWSWLPKICAYEVTNIMISQNKKREWKKKYRAMRIVNGSTVDDQINFEFNNIGKTVFLTREEAEAALRKSGDER